MLSYLRFRYHRGIRRWRRNLNLWRRWSLHYVQRHVYGAWRNLLHLGWRIYLSLGLLTIGFVGLIAQMNSLNSIYLVRQPVAGGIYSEGLVGDVKVLNPILTDSPAASDVDRLIFSGLTQFDGQGKIVGDLANSWSISPDFKTFDFKLRPDARWQDGSPVTADDVAFTIGLIQDPDTRAAQALSWKGIKTTIVGPHEIEFVLPASYPSFLSVTTVGILPKHLLASIPAANLRLNSFNQNPVGSGPFAFDSLSDQGIITLKRNDSYYAGRPLLDGVKFYLYPSDTDLANGYARRQIVGFGDASPNQLATERKLPQIQIRTMAQPSYIGLFFNTQNAKLTDAAIRGALGQAINRDELIQLPGGENGQASVQSLPLFTQTLGIDYDSVTQYSPTAAKLTLAQQLAGKRLNLNLVTKDSPNFLATATTIMQQLSAVGVGVNITAVDTDTLEQNFIRPRKYDMLLFGEDIGADPDVYNFWHSSQAQDPGLNLSQYKSPMADKYLESARLAKDPTNRRAKQLAFLQTWDADTPAVILYSPRYLYAQSRVVTASPVSRLITPVDRFYNIQTWAVRYQRLSRPALR